MCLGNVDAGATAKRLVGRVEGDMQLLISRRVQINTEKVQTVLQQAADACGAHTRSLATHCSLFATQEQEEII